MLSLEIALTGVLLFTVAIGFAAALLAWRKHPEPGAVPLVVLLSGSVWWAAFLLFEIRADAIARKILWSNVQWIGVVVIPVAWLLFAMEYTGRDQYARRSIVAGLFVVPVVTVALALTDQYHALLHVDTTTVEYAGLVLLDRTPGVWYWVIAAYTYLLGALGIVPLLYLIRSDSLPFRAQSQALIVGSVAPWTTNVLFVAGVLPIPNFDPTPIAFAITGVAFLAAIDRFELMGINPTPNRRARRLIFDEMSDPAIVLDGNDHLVDMNDVAEQEFDRTRKAHIGDPVTSVLPAMAPVLGAGDDPETVTIETRRGETPFDISTTDVTDLHGRRIGRVVTFHDVGDYLRQQQRLEVLNRVFRHNLRTETQIVMGYADRLDDEDDDVRILKKHTREIADLGEKAREIITIFDQEQAGAQPTSLSVMLEDAVEAVRENYTNVSVELDRVDDGYRVATLLEPVFENVLENAVEHNPDTSPWVGVSVDPGADTVTVRIADDGPGMDESEYGVIAEGTETPLEHASGLGLWLIHWGTQVAGGTVRFEENEPTGTVVSVEVPRLDETAN